MWGKDRNEALEKEGGNSGKMRKETLKETKLEEDSEETTRHSEENTEMLQSEKEILVKRKKKETLALGKEH